MYAYEGDNAWHYVAHSKKDAIVCPDSDYRSYSELECTVNYAPSKQDTHSNNIVS